MKKGIYLTKPDRFGNTPAFFEVGEIVEYVQPGILPGVSHCKGVDGIPKSLANDRMEYIGEI